MSWTFCLNALGTANLSLQSTFDDNVHYNKL